MSDISVLYTDPAVAKAAHSLCGHLLYEYMDRVTFIDDDYQPGEGWEQNSDREEKNDGTTITREYRRKRLPDIPPTDEERCYRDWQQYQTEDERYHTWREKWWNIVQAARVGLVPARITVPKTVFMAAIKERDDKIKECIDIIDTLNKSVSAALSGIGDKLSQGLNTVTVDGLPQSARSITAHSLLDNKQAGGKALKPVLSDIVSIPKAEAPQHKEIVTMLKRFFSPTVVTDATGRIVPNRQLATYDHDISNMTLEMLVPYPVGFYMHDSNRGLQFYIRDFSTVDFNCFFMVSGLPDLSTATIRAAVVPSSGMDEDEIKDRTVWKDVTELSIKEFAALIHRMEIVLHVHSNICR